MTTATLSRIFTAINKPYSSVVNRHIPMINSITNSLGSYLTSVSQISKKRSLMNWYKATPELNALVNKVAKDIVYRYHFEPINSRESGRNKIEKANKFAQQIGARKIMLSQVIDQLVTGEGFGWMGKLPDDVIKEKVMEISGKYGSYLEKKERKSLGNEIYTELKAVEGFADSSHVDEDLLRPRKFRCVPSTTVEVIHDEYDVLHYNHKVGTTTIQFKPKEIIHFTFMNVDGKVNGFTPVESTVVQLELLRQMWQNMLSIHKNGGAPDLLLGVENIQPNSPAYKRIEQQLEKYNIVENKHGTLLFTGKINVHELNQIDKMQFMDSGLYITGLVAMQWQIPRSSIPYIVGGTNTKDDTGGNSEKGYWRNIEISQEMYAETINSQLWIPHFGVKIVLIIPSYNKMYNYKPLNNLN